MKMFRIDGCAVPNCVVVRRAARVITGFKMQVGLLKRSALSLFLFAMVMDSLTGKIRHKVLWTMMFVDDIVCSESKKKVEGCLERWRCALEEGKIHVHKRKE